MGSGGKALRTLLGAVIFLSVILFLLVGVIANDATKATTVETPPTRFFKHWKFIGEGRRHLHKDMHLNYVSKRRVPNGPDPIHNRGIVKSRQPPGRF